ncbi:MAG: D-alanyl-D-alanine carboxypeptidase [Faecalibacterium sp.]
MRKKLFQKLVATSLAFGVLLAAALPAAALYDLPVEPYGEDESILLMNMDTGEVILDQGADTIRYVASTTKMMTALLLIESGYDLNTVVTVSTDLTAEFALIQVENGADMDLKIGEEITMRELLYGLLLRSANDAASVIAYELAGDIDTFVSQMNARATALGCTKTNFTCPHGLYDTGNASTANDLALIAAACAAEPLYMEVANTLTYTIAANNMHSSEREVTSTNFMIDPESDYYREYINGMKTGFTTLAGRCFVTTATQDGEEYLLVVLNSIQNDIYQECADILDWAFANFDTYEFLSEDEALGEVLLLKSYDAEVIVATAEHSVSGFANLADDIIYTVDLIEEIEAPVAVGDYLGSVSVYREGVLIETVDILSPADYANSTAVDVKNTLTMLPFLLAFVFLLAVATRIASKLKK